jgi:hypothetical protein
MMVRWIVRLLTALELTFAISKFCEMTECKWRLTWGSDSQFPRAEAVSKLLDDH